MRTDWTIWTLAFGVIIFANVGFAFGAYWEGDQLLGNTYTILAGLLALIERG